MSGKHSDIFSVEEYNNLMRTPTSRNNLSPPEKRRIHANYEKQLHEELKKSLEMEVTGLKDGTLRAKTSTASPLRVSEEDPKMKDIMERLERERFESTEEGKMVKSKLALSKTLAERNHQMEEERKRKEEERQKKEQEAERQREENRRAAEEHQNALRQKRQKEKEYAEFLLQQKAELEAKKKKEYAIECKEGEHKRREATKALEATHKAEVAHRQQVIEAVEDSKHFAEYNKKVKEEKKRSEIDSFASHLDENVKEWERTRKEQMSIIEQKRRAVADILEEERKTKEQLHQEHLRKIEAQKKMMNDDKERAEKQSKIMQKDTSIHLTQVEAEAKKRMEEKMSASEAEKAYIQERMESARRKKQMEEEERKARRQQAKEVQGDMKAQMELRQLQLEKEKMEQKLLAEAIRKSQEDEKFLIKNRTEKIVSDSANLGSAVSPLVKTLSHVSA